MSTQRHGDPQQSKETRNMKLIPLMTEQGEVNDMSLYTRVFEDHSSPRGLHLYQIKQKTLVNTGKKLK